MDEILNKKTFFFSYFFIFRGDESLSALLPVLTLYTHENCSLCDDLVEELELNFQGRYQLEKVDITRKENLKFLRLYRLDIPVCFLNGQYLCKHRLNNELLEKRLRKIENSL